MKKRKRKIKTAISGYQELLAIKKELKRDITKQEKSIKNDLLNVGKIYRTLRKVLFTKKKKKNTMRNNNNNKSCNQACFTNNPAQPHIHNNTKNG